MSLGNALLGILFFAALLFVFIFLFMLNRKTPKPPGCENLRPDCAGCKDWSCPNHAKAETDLLSSDADSAARIEQAEQNKAE